MIGTDDMSSTSMDISETFRPEDLSKTDFFDFVTAPDIGIGGIGGHDGRPPGSNDTNGSAGDPALQGYDQVHKTGLFYGVLLCFLRSCLLFDVWHILESFIYGSYHKSQKNYQFSNRNNEDIII